MNLGIWYTGCWLIPEIASQNSFGIKGDFVEAPSQFLENWCWEYDALKLFAKHYKTGETLPKDLFDKMKQTQRVNVGSFYIRQVSLGLTDFTFEDKYEETKQKGVLKVFKEITLLNQMPFDDDNHMICSFGHLNGYGANYYGYLWSKVYAQDNVFRFHKERCDGHGNRNQIPKRNSRKRIDHARN